ncbi:FAD-dependent oxidoreductase [Candidatus Paracaedibacter symbiosus]|uniref:FAD-dependent oxidoreductase n=1 Tax=Candidatus Paracaedibacter symbiosus TaxID=244582 RepID=UPI0018DB81CB|nr:FAD-dependent oxidoreductase [Candidatus Paracaedibacter symbiosus]
MQSEEGLTEEQHKGFLNKSQYWDKVIEDKATNIKECFEIAQEYLKASLKEGLTEKQRAGFLNKSQYWYKAAEDKATDIDGYFRIAQKYLHVSLMKGLTKKQSVSFLNKSQYWHESAENKATRIDGYLRIAQKYLNASEKVGLNDEQREKFLASAQSCFAKAEGKATLIDDHLRIAQKYLDALWRMNLNDEQRDKFLASAQSCLTRAEEDKETNIDDYLQIAQKYLNALWQMNLNDEQRDKFLASAQSCLTRAEGKATLIDDHLRIAQKCLDALWQMNLNDEQRDKFLASAQSCLTRTESKAASIYDYLQIAQEYLNASEKVGLNDEQRDKFLASAQSCLTEAESKAASISDYIQIAQKYLDASLKVELKNEQREKFLTSAKSYFTQAESKATSIYNYLQIAQEYLNASLKVELKNKLRHKFLTSAKSCFTEAKNKATNISDYLQIAREYLEAFSRKELKDEQRNKFLASAQSCFIKAKNNKATNISDYLQIARECLDISLKVKLKDEQRNEFFTFTLGCFTQAESKATSTDDYIQIAQECLNASLKEGLKNEQCDKFLASAQSCFTEAKNKAISIVDYIQIAQKCLNISLKVKLKDEQHNEFFTFTLGYFTKAENKATSIDDYIQIAQKCLDISLKVKLKDEQHNEFFTFTLGCFTKAENKATSVNDYIQIAQKCLNASLKEGLKNEQHNEFLTFTLSCFTQAESKATSTDDYIQIAQECLNASLKEGLKNEQRDKFLDSARSCFANVENKATSVNDYIQIAQGHLTTLKTEKNKQLCPKFLDQLKTWFKNFYWRGDLEVYQALDITKTYLDYAQLSKVKAEIRSNILQDVDDYWRDLIVRKGNILQSYKLGKLYLKISKNMTLDHQTRDSFLNQGLKIFSEATGKWDSDTVTDPIKAYNIGKTYLEIADLYKKSFRAKERSYALSQAEKCFERADQLGGVDPKKAYNQAKQYPWLMYHHQESIEEKIALLKKWLENTYGEYGYAYWLGEYQLESEGNRAKALQWFKKAFEERSEGSPVAAYHLGMIYASYAPYETRCKLISRQWFRQGEQSIQENIKKEWETKSLTENRNAYKYAYALKQLYKAQGKEIGELSDEIKTKALDYKKACQSRPLVKGVLEPLNLSHEPYECVVMGGGLTGILSAIHLANLRNVDNKPLFKVTLLEKEAHLMSGASMIAGRLHLGGEYPLNKATAQDCLYGASLFRLMIPYGYTDIPAVTYVIDNQTQIEAERSKDIKGLTAKKMNKRYQKRVVNPYTHFFSFVKNSTYESESFFGEPSDLARPLGANELNLNGFAGGIVTHEKGLNPAILGAYLEEQLKQAGVEVKCNQRVKEAKEKFYGYKVYTDNSKYRARLVVNGTWDNAMELDMNILSQEKQATYPDAQVHMRGMGIIDISQCTLPEIATKYKRKQKEKEGKGKEKAEENETEEVTLKERTAIFGLLGEQGGMFSPFNSQVGLVYWPSKEGSYIKSLTLKKDDPNGWEVVKRYEISDKEKQWRLEKILENLRQKYPYLEGATGIKLIVRPTLSYEEDLAKRPHTMVQVLGDRNWINAQSLKATFAPLTALEVIYHILENIESLGISEKSLPGDTHHARTWLRLMHNWMSNKELPSVDVYQGVILPELFCLPNNIDDQTLKDKARQWAKDHDLPEEIAN